MQCTVFQLYLTEALDSTGDYFGKYPSPPVALKAFLPCVPKHIGQHMGQAVDMAPPHTTLCDLIAPRQKCLTAALLDLLQATYTCAQHWRLPHPLYQATKQPVCVQVPF